MQRPMQICHQMAPMCRESAHVTSLGNGSHAVGTVRCGGRSNAILRTMMYMQLDSKITITGIGTSVTAVVVPPKSAM